MIPFYPWRPDHKGINLESLADVNNVFPAPTGYLPMPGLSAVSEALSGEPRGAAAIANSAGEAKTFVGTTTKLFRLDAVTLPASWEDVSRTSGGAYAVPSEQKWRFASFGDLAIATQVGDVPQKYNLISATDFSALGGTPPKARYVAVVADFVVLAALENNEFRIHWSGLNDAEFWTAGSQSSDTQDMPDGGPIRGLIGALGVAGYIFQASAIRRMLFQPGSPTIFQIDKIEDARGLLSPESLVQVGALIFYLAEDGFYQLTDGGSIPLGAKEISDFFVRDVRSDKTLAVDGAADPINQRVIWSYVSKDNATEIPDRVIVYDWAQKEWSKGDVEARDVLKYVSPGYTLDSLDVVDDLDALLYSLDSPIWAVGRQIVGAIDADGKLAVFSGENLEARFETNDFQIVEGSRTEVMGLAPIIDAESVTARVGTRERLHETHTWSEETVIEDTGVIPFHHSGRYVRARVTVPAGETWTFAQGVQETPSEAGSR